MINMKSKKAQVAVEYMLIIGFIVVATSIILYTLGIRMQEIQTDSKIEFTQDLAKQFDVQVELGLAANDGYKSVFYMPIKTNYLHVNYSSFQNQRIEINYSGYSTPYDLSAGGVVADCLNNQDGVRHVFVIDKYGGNVSLSSCVDCETKVSQCYEAEVIGGGNCVAGGLTAAQEAECQAEYCMC